MGISKGSPNRGAYTPSPTASVWRTDYPHREDVSEGDFWISFSGEHYVRMGGLWIPFLGVSHNANWIAVCNPTPPDEIDLTNILWIHTSGIYHRKDERTDDWIPANPAHTKIVQEYASVADFLTVNPQFKVISEAPKPNFEELPDAYGGF
jgi:hypothetical protein